MLPALEPCIYQSLLLPSAMSFHWSPNGQERCARAGVPLCNCVAAPALSTLELAKVSRGRAASERIFTLTVRKVV